MSVVATAITPEHHQALSKAKIALMATPDSAFFTTICFSLRLLWDDRIATAGTDGLKILFNPSWFMKLDTQERVFLMLHETLHVAYCHNQRFVQGMCHDRANIAMDHVINLQLLERGFKMPKGGHADKQFTGMSWEQVYKLLPDNPGKPQMADLNPGSGAGNMSPETAAAMQREVDDILVRAAIQSKMSGDKPGTIPGDIQLHLDGLLDPKLPWNRILQKYLNSFAKNDYSWRKPNRRFFPEHHMPSLHGEKLMDLTIAVDISGSVSEHDFKVFVTEVASIFRMMNPEKITLIQFDTKIHHVDKVGSIKELMGLTFTGRGGTDVTPVMEWAQEKKPQLLMVFSDGEFHMPGTKPRNSEVLWLIHNNPKFEPPFGKTIHYKI